MKTIEKEISAAQEIKKSSFIAYLAPLASFEALRARLRRQHPKARHIVWAYRALNEPGQIVENSSDDGEPKSTAGAPCLNALRGAELINAAVLVVRYFGGIKLGAGGLVRAYTDTVATALQQAVRVPIIRQVVLGCRVGYELEGALRREIAAREGVLLDVAHAADISVQLQLPEPQVEAFRTWLDDAGHGRVQWFEPEKADEA